jgi:hypothetical protein
MFGFDRSNIVLERVDVRFPPQQHRVRAHGCSVSTAATSWIVSNSIGNNAFMLSRHRGLFPNSIGEQSNPAPTPSTAPNLRGRLVQVGC